MVGDGELVFLYEVNPDGAVSPARCYRSADGVEVTIPDSSAAFTNVKRARFYGRKVLAFDDEPGKKAVRLYDLFTGKDVWKRDLGADGWQLRSEDDAYTGYVTVNGDVVVLNAADGKDVFKSKLDEARKAKQLEKVNEAILFADAEHFFVMLNRPSEGGNRFGPNAAFAQAIRSVKVNGHMYAYERATGKRLWYTDEQLEDQNISVEQFADLPIIIAASMYQKFAANGNFEGQYMKFAALDKATGKLKFYRQGMGQNSQYYSIITDPKTGTIEVLNYSGQRVRFVPDDGKTVGAKDGPAGPSVGSTGISIPVPAGPAPPVKIKR
jgi:outer membrane protein assembly factor BamB